MTDTPPKFNPAPIPQIVPNHAPIQQPGADIQRPIIAPQYEQPQGAPPLPVTGPANYPTPPGVKP